MSQEIKIEKSKVPADMDALYGQFSELRDDMATLMSTVGGMVERRGQRLTNGLTDGVDDALHYVGRKGRKAEAQLEKSVREHPMLALSVGLAAGAGLLVGILYRR